MPRDDEGVEEAEIGGRVYRRLSDGQVVEVLPDGSYERDYTVGGQSLNSRSTDFETIVEARRPAGGGEPTDDDRIREYIAQKGGDERLQDIKQTHSNFAFKGSLKEILDATPKGTQLGGFHGIGGRHGMSGATKLESQNVDPLRQVLVSRKPTTYAEHIRRLSGGRDGGQQSSKGSGGSLNRRPARLK